MLAEAPHGGEAAPAGRAAEGFPSCVDELVALQVSLLAELFAAHGALERLLAAVDAFVPDEVLGHAEAPPTQLTDEWLLATVRAQVQRDAGLSGEGFPTLRAAERLPLRVAATVGLQVARGAVAPPTHIAEEGLSSCVQLQVRL